MRRWCILTFRLLRLGAQLRGLHASDVVAKIQRPSNWLVHRSERLHSSACPFDGEAAVVQKAAEDGLVDLYGFDLVHMHFGRLARNKSALVDDPPVRHRDLLDPPFDPGAGEKDHADGNENDLDHADRETAAP